MFSAGISTSLLFNYYSQQKFSYVQDVLSNAWERSSDCLTKRIEIKLSWYRTSDVPQNLYLALEYFETEYVDQTELCFFFRKMTEF